MSRSGSPDNNDRKIECEVLSDKLLTENAEQNRQDECAQYLTCLKNVPSKESLPNHLCDNTYICFECTPIKNLSTEKQLNNHRRKFHKRQGFGYKCQLCNETFLSPRKLRSHKKFSHVFTKTFPCQFCDERFISENEVKAHERSIHKGQIISTTRTNPTISFQPSSSSSSTLNEGTPESTVRVIVERKLDVFDDYANPNEFAALKMPETESICDFESFPFYFPTESVLKEI
uniref:C2H2-type domain-containing protein n=1 Tax=Panagrolaimus davidi TaxID=227884 RepID=A0A914Q7W7_9BILA